MTEFLTSWAEAALTTLAFFWMAFWAFCLGYVISSMIQVFVTEERMKQTMGEAGPKSVALGTFFGFISSSCSFAALSTTRSLFQKGAGLVPALAFLLSSTNLVIELGILIFVFLSWQFVVGEYLGGILLILIMWVVVRLTLPSKLEDEARKHAKEAAEEDEADVPDWRKLMKSLQGWRKVSQRYFMEWHMVWKDVTFGFTVAGIIAAFVPASFFQALFIGSGGDGNPAWWQTVLHTLIGPLAAFFTFIGSMGNIPLAGILLGSGVSFAGIMAFIFSDLVVFPVLRISGQYFGWKMAVYILSVFLFCLVVTSLLLHFGFMALDLLPEHQGGSMTRQDPASHFQLDYTFAFNVVFGLVSVGFALLWRWFGSSEQDKHQGHDHGHDHGDHDDDDGNDGGHSHHHHGGGSWVQQVLRVLAIGAIVWLVGGFGLWIAGWR